MQAMTPQEARDFVARNRFGVLSLADGGRAYGLPLFYAWDGKALYFHTRPGSKQRYAVATTQACFTVVRVDGLDDWASIQAFGRLSRAPDDLHTMETLMPVPLPPDWGETARGAPMRHDIGAIQYRLEPVRFAGRYSRHLLPEARRPELGEVRP